MKIGQPPSREKILLGLFLLLAVGWLGSGAIYGLLFGEVDQRKQTVKTLEEKVFALERQSNRVKHARRLLVELDEAERTLPGNHSAAVTLYQNWLIHQTRASGWPGAMIIPGQPVKETVGVYRVPFTIQGVTDLATLGGFLDEFYRLNLLHKVTYLSLAGGSDTQAQQVVLNVECLSLLETPARERLTAPDNISAPSSAGDQQSLALFFSQRNPFATTVDSFVPASEDNRFLPDDDSPPEETSAGSSPLRLVAALQNGSTRQALFWDADQQKEIVIKEGDSLEEVGLAGLLQTVRTDSVIVELQGVQQRLELGDTLDSLQMPEAG